MLNRTDAVQTNNGNTSTRQPMRFGGILDTTFSLYRKHFRLFLGIIALYFCGNLGVYLLGRFLPDFPLKNLVTDLLRMPFSLVSMGGIIIATATIYLGKRITSRDALKQAGHRFWHLLASHLLWSLVFVLSRTVVLSPIAYYTVYVMPTESMSSLFVFIRLIAVPFAINLPMDWGSITYGLIPLVMRPGQTWISLIPSALAPFALYFAVRWMFATPAVLLERPLIRRAFERSSALTRGRWWQTWGMLISFSVLSFAIWQIMEITVGFILALTKLTNVTDPMDIIRMTVMYAPIDTDRLFLEIIWWTRFVLRTLIFPIWVIGITLLYLDLRIRKEEFDIEIQPNTATTPT